MSQKKSLLVTGACGKLASEVIPSLLSGGYSVVGLDSRAPASELQWPFHVLDLNDFDAVKRELPTLLTQHQVSGVIQFAGRIHNEPLINLLNPKDPYHGADAWKSVLDSNLSTSFYVGAVCAHWFVKNRKGGVIVNVSSIAANGNIGQSAYSAAKAGVEALTRTWSKELGPWGVRTVCIQPGFFDVSTTHQAMGEKGIEQVKRQIPLKRLGAVGELQSAIEFALENEFLNGEVLKINGGQVL